MATANFKFRDKLLTMRRLISTVFYHDQEYIDLAVACFAAKAPICFLGGRGSGKSHLCEVIYNMVEDDIRAKVQGRLNAGFEEVWARPHLPSLMNGEEKVIWAKAAKAMFIWLDEIQRLGPEARNAMFEKLTTGKITYLDVSEGEEDFVAFLTANPTEGLEDQTCIPLEEPLWDRFVAVCWLPVPRLKHLLRINGHEEEMKENLPKLWDRESLLGLWEEVKAIKVPKKLDYIITLMVRITMFCKEAPGYDGASLLPAQKRELCSKCNTSYICARIARPPSVRAKLALIRLARGFAYLAGREEVTLEDVKRAWPYVMWKRLEFMDEDEIANKYQALVKLAEDIITEIKEAEEAIKLAEELKNGYDQAKWAALERWCASKIWLLEVKEELEDYYRALADKLRAKWEEARRRNDKITMLKLQAIAEKKLPPNLARDFTADVELEVVLTPQSLAKIAKADSSLFQALKAKMDSGETTVKLKGKAALIWLSLNLPVKGGESE